METEAKKPEIKWTPSQEAAIKITDRTLLVSAAAGSGKTATLTERVIRSITEGGADISKMLIVTYTRAAAAELRSRIFTALSNALAKNPSDPDLNKQLIKLGSASICTIDSFYFNLVRQNFSTLGISASQRIGDEGELELLKASLTEEVIDEFFETRDDFPSLVDCLVRVKSINSLPEHILNLYDAISAYPDGIKFLKNNADSLRDCASDGGDIMVTKFGKTLRKELKKRLEANYKPICEAYDVTICNYADALLKRAEVTYASDRHDIMMLCNILETGTYDEIRTAFLNHKLTRMATPRNYEEDETTLLYKGFHEKLGKEIKSIKEDFFSRSPEDLCAVITKTADFSELLYDLLLRFEKRYSEEKTRRNIMDFTDVRRLAHGLLVNENGGPTDFALEYKKLFTHIYIDEYQDVDIIQDQIFSAISDNNRFMVGDIKQSIYGFRNADPSVFAGYKSRLPLYDLAHPNDRNYDALSIFMSENFRCDEPIIDFTNLVCKTLFNASKESIGYTDADDLKFTKNPKDNYDGYVSDKVNLSVIITADGDNDDDTDSPSDGHKKKKKKKKDPDAPCATELEAKFIAAEINKLIGKKKRADGNLIKAGDIAILYRTGAMVPYLTDALAKYNIRCSEGGGDSYFENPDVLLVLSLLNVVDNPHRDIHLAGVLCSPLYDFTLDQLITVRHKTDSAYSLYDALLFYCESESDELAEKCKHFNGELEKLRAASVALPVDRFMRLLFESDIFVESGLLSDRDSNGDGGNLLRLYDYARSFESGSFKGLYNFIEFINSLIENDKKLEVAKKASNDSIVTLTTMHHSKGLEFPVCFVCGAGRGKNMKGLYKSMLYDKDIGLAMKLPDSTGLARINTPLHKAVYMGKYLSEIEEEMRILYVAMTRAREKLYITATSSSTEEELIQDARMRSKYPSDYSIDKCLKFLDWLLIPFAYNRSEVDCANLHFISSNTVAELEAQTDAEPMDYQAVPKDEALYDKLVNEMAFVYPHTHLRCLPSKLSVSKLYPDMLDTDGSAAELSPTDKRASVPDFFLSGDSKKASAAERGTATHLFFQFCDFHRAKAHGATEELDRLSECGFISKDIAELVYRDELERFMDSELIDRIFKAVKTDRERRFNLLLPADSFTSSEATADSLDGESLAVQGVIDLILIDENGDIELYDYKTDRLTSTELSSYGAAKKTMNERHGLQLSYYAYAVEALFERKCKRVCIYSTHSGKLYDIDRVPLRLP